MTTTQPTGDGARDVIAEIAQRAAAKYLGVSEGSMPATHSVIATSIYEAIVEAISTERQAREAAEKRAEAAEQQLAELRAEFDAWKTRRIGVEEYYTVKSERDEAVRKAKGLEAEVKKLETNLATAELENDMTHHLFDECYKRALKVWQAKHPDKPLVHPDGAAAMTGLIEHLESELAAAQADNAALLDAMVNALGAGYHAKTCAWRKKEKCNCGFDEARIEVSKILATPRPGQSLNEEVERLRGALTEAVVAIEPLAAQIEMKPYREITPELQQIVVKARDMIRLALNIPSTPAAKEGAE